MRFCTKLTCNYYQVMHMFTIFVYARLVLRTPGILRAKFCNVGVQMIDILMA